MINKKHITLFTLCAFTVASLFTNVQAAEKDRTFRRNVQLVPGSGI